MTRFIKLEDEHADVVYELLLRGLRETHPADREYSEAFDAFVDAAGYPRRIGDQPENVREAWEELFEECERS